MMNKMTTFFSNENFPFIHVIQAVQW